MHTTPNRRSYDRHEFYVGIHLGLVGAALGLVLTPYPPGALAGLPLTTTHALAASMMVGSLMCLAGAAAPLRYWFPQRGKDMRGPLTAGAFGLATVAVAVIVWGLFIIATSNFVGGLSGCLSVAIGMACIKLIRRFWRHRGEVIAVRADVAGIIADERAAANSGPQQIISGHTHDGKDHRE